MVVSDTVKAGHELRNPFFLDRYSGFDWTVSPIGTGQRFSLFFLSMGLI